MVEKLDGRNYREWAQSIKLINDGKVKLGYLTGETKKPTSTDTIFLPSKMVIGELHADHVAHQLHEAHDWKEIPISTHRKRHLGSCEGD